MNNQKGDRREMVDLEKMRVRDLIVFYLKTEKKDHTAHRDEIVNEFDEWLDYAVSLNDNIPLSTTK